MPINTTMRFGGMASGLDTESMIRNMMKIEQMKVDRVIQQKTSMEWTQTLRADLNKQITDFRHSVMSVLSDKNLNAASAFKGNKVSGIPSGAGVAVTAGASAFQGNYTIKVNQLASGATMTSGDLSDIDLGGGLEQLGVVFADDEISFRINDAEFTMNRDTTVRQMIDQINKSDAGVQMRFSELTGTIAMNTTATGEAARLEIETVTGQMFDESWTQNSGTDAQVVINGISVQRGENVFSIDGVHYRVVAETDETLQFNVEQNIDETVDRVKNFVDQYNKLLASLQETINQPVYRGFPPLTDTQRAEMGDREIEMWEEKAMSGLLRNDRALSTLVSQMRSGMFNAVAGTNMNLTSIGIMTSSYQEQGQLHLNEDALRRALAEDPDNVMKLFTQTSTAEDGSTRRSESGLLQRLRDSYSGYTEASYKPARYAENMVRINNQINRMNAMLQQKEDSYWRQFAAMEQALNSMYTQTSSLMASLGMN